MKINWYLLQSGQLIAQPAPDGLPSGDPAGLGENWFDMEGTDPDLLRQFLAPLQLHPLLLERSVGSTKVPGTMSYEPAVLVNFPIDLDSEAGGLSYLTILLLGNVLVTIRPCPVPALADLVRGLTAAKAPNLQHLAQLLYEILDSLADANVRSEIEVRDRISHLAQALSESPGSVAASDLTTLSGRVDKLVSLVENQLYCVTGLNASDAKALQEPHRKAYLADLVSEAEIAQRGVYRLESRMKDLYDYYQMAGSDRVEKRLRILTILSAVGLPLGLITGVLGMNVGGLPGTSLRYAFALVLGAMCAIALAELWYFKRSGWFD